MSSSKPEMNSSGELSSSPSTSTPTPTPSQQPSKITKWIILRRSSCDCSPDSKSLITAFVHATDDNGNMTEENIDDYICTYKQCACKGTFMGHYTKYCGRCKNQPKMDDDEIEDL